MPDDENATDDDEIHDDIEETDEVSGFAANLSLNAGIAPKFNPMEYWIGQSWDRRFARHDGSINHDDYDDDKP